MRIRTQLILASFVLAVVPLAAIVTYTYHSSRRALEGAYVREADRLTQQMDRRLASIRAELDQRLNFVSALPVSDANSGEVGSSIAAAMGDVTSMVDALEYKPIDPPPPSKPAQVAAAKPLPEPARTAEAPQPPEPKPVDPKIAELDPTPAVKVRVVQQTAVSEATAQALAIAARMPAIMHSPHPPGAPMVIDLPDAPLLPRYVMSEKQRELLSEIGRLGSRLGKPGLDAEERDDITSELNEAQEELNRVVAEDTRRYREQIQAARGAARSHRRTMEGQAARGGGQNAPLITAAAAPDVNAVPAVAPVPAAQPAPATPPAGAALPMREESANERAKARATERRTTLILGKDFKAPVRKEGEVVGQLSPRINPDVVVRRVLGSSTEDGTEVPFAIDKEGTLYTRTPEERRTLERLDIPRRIRSAKRVKNIPGWIVSTSTDEQSGLKFGVARPIGGNFDELRRTAGRNFMLGLGVIAFALIGIVPLSNHLTRDVKIVTEGAERVAHGDLMTRLPVKTKNELGQLAKAFNRMAEDLSLQQQKLLEQERARKEQELQQRLLAVEYERKTVELEDARRFQLSMLPKEVPHIEGYDIAVYTRTATEVGGDYYDFHNGTKGVLSVTIGDATGHGAKAGTMVTVVKTLFSGYGADSPAHFLGDAAEKIKRMELGRMSMALSVGRFDGQALTLSSAGMPPVLVHRVAADSVEEISLEATPLGTLETEYREITVTLASGDTVLFLSDGFPELLNDGGQQLGYVATLDAFAVAAHASDANGVIASLEQTVREWHGDAPPNDDVTFVVVRVA